jgi:SAM-dependent methyltransferase
MPAGTPPSSAQRRSLARTAVVWEALCRVLADVTDATVVDIGGGTGGLAVRVAELGHRVTVVDPNPDALAILDRRADERGVTERVRGVQGDVATVLDWVPRGEADLVLCHGVLEVVDDPAAAVSAIVETLRPGGTLSLLVAQRHAAVVTRAMAGHFTQARELLDPPPAGRAGPAGHAGAGMHRFTAAEVTALLTAAGMADVILHAVRVFADLVPSFLVELEPGASDALVDLELAVAERPEYLTLAAQVHALAVRP